MLHLRLLLESTEAPTESNLDGRYQPKAAPELLRLKELAGLRQGALRKFPRNEQCQPRLGARSQQHSGQDGRRLGGARKRPDLEVETRFSSGMSFRLQFGKPREALTAFKAVGGVTAGYQAEARSPSKMSCWALFHFA